MPRRLLAAALLATVVLAGCGGDDDDDTGREPRAASSADLRAELKGATDAKASDFPAAKGRTMRAVAEALDGAGPQVALATSIFTPKNDRLAFGVIDPKSGFVYGKTAVYVADGPDKKAQGPFPAPADLLVTDAPFRSQTAASEKDPFAAIYSTKIPLDKAGPKRLLVVTQVQGKLYGATAQIQVKSDAADKIPAPGEKAPEFHTETEAGAGGDIKSIDTRVPPSDMHENDAADVIGKKPVAVLFATPQLCQSRVCGPVVDIAAQLKSQYGDRMEFIHQEVYVDNKLDKGLRPPLRAFNLPTEPWLFVIGKDGRIKARLEGSFGFDAFQRAVRAGL